MNTLCFPRFYITFKRKTLSTPRIKLAKDLNRFCYRYRLAKSFSALIAPEVGNTLASYSIVTKVFLAVTAYELIVRTGHQHKTHTNNFKSEFNEPTLADNIRDNVFLKKVFSDYLKPNELKDKVDDFYQTFTADVNCIAFGLRHVFAHGNLTISAAGMRKAQYRKDIAQLAEVTLKHADKLFSQFVAQL